MTIGWIAWLMLGSDAVRTRLVRAGTLLQRNSRVVGIGIAAVTLIYSDIFHFSNVGPNIVRYPTWAVQIYSPFLFLALIAPFLKHTSEPFARRRWNSWQCTTVCISIGCVVTTLILAQLLDLDGLSAGREDRLPEARHTRGTPRHLVVWLGRGV